MSLSNRIHYFYLYRCRFMFYVNCRYKRASDLTQWMLEKLNYCSLIGMVLFLLAQSFEIYATAETKGWAIAQKLKAANKDFKGESSSIELILIDAHGTRIVRKIENNILEQDGGNRSLLTFLNPLDVKGTKLLTWTHNQKDDDQWLYLPSLRRVKRISSRNKSASFMGSEFSYEDLGSQEIEKYIYYLEGEKELNGEEVWILKRVPKKKSGYTKLILYISKKYINPVKVEYFDRKETLLKFSMFSGYKQFLIGKKQMYRASSVHMKNVQTRKESIFIWLSRKLGVEQKKIFFKKSSLK